MTIKVTFAMDMPRLESQGREHTNFVILGLNFLRLKSIILSWDIQITAFITEEFP